MRGQQIGIGAFDTRREAAQAIARFAGNYATRPVGDRRASRQTVAEFAESWWQTRTGHRLSTQVRDREALNRDVLPFFGEAQLVRLDPADVQAWVEKLSHRVAPSTVRRTFVVLDQLLASAVERGLIASSPSKAVRLPRVARPEARFLTPIELERLASVIDPRYRAMVLVMAWATLRIGEASGLRRRDVDLDTGSIRIANSAVQVLGRPVEGPPKTRAGLRSMTLPPSVMKDLALHLDRQSGLTYVFGPSGDRPLLADDWRTRVWRRAVINAELSPLRPHDLKHTGVALLALAGVDPSEIARRAGHTSVSFTYDHYGHLFPEIDKQAGLKLERVRAVAGEAVIEQRPHRQG